MLQALGAYGWFAVQLMLALMAASVWRIFDNTSMAEISELSGDGAALTLGTGNSLVSSFVVGAVIAPDVSRYAKSPKHVVGGAVLAFVVVFRSWKTWQLTGIAGAIGIALALAGIYDSFTTFLTVLGIFIPPMAGVIIVDYYITRKTVYRGGFEKAVVPVRVLSLAAWAIGSGAGALTSYTDVTMTSIPALDGLLVAGILHALFGKYIDNRSAVIEHRQGAGYEYPD